MRLFSALLLFAILQVRADESTDVPIVQNKFNNIVIISNANNDDRCLGALIHPLWIVTSGVCALKTLYYDKRVFFAQTPAIFDYGAFIANTYIHQNFTKNPLNDDIALIKLATPADKSIRTLKIPKYKYDLTAVKAVSFGAYPSFNYCGNGTFNPQFQLKSQWVIIMNEELCARYPVSISETRYCAFPAVGCEGDEGGPLVYGNILLGVTSVTPIQAALCKYAGCNSLFPVTTYTDLFSYREWIVNVTGLAII